MPRGKPTAGFRKTKKYKTETLQELEQDIASKAPAFFEELERYVKPFSCPHCGNEIQVIDKEVAMYLLDRALGKPKQKHEVDITETIQLNADQIDDVVRNHLPQIVGLYPNEIIGILMESPETKAIIRNLLTQGGVIEGDVREIASKGESQEDNS